MTFNQWDIVIVPFPFVNSLKSKPRPVLIVSSEKFNETNEHYLGAMITSSQHDNWIGDVSISEKDSTGLNSPSKVRMKLFTLDQRLIKKRIGRLNQLDIENVRKEIEELFLIGN